MPQKMKVGDVVVLLPGILGSVLQIEGHDVWAPSKGALLRGLFSLGRSVKSLELTSTDDIDKDDVGDGVTASRLMPDIHLIPRFWKIDGYTKIREVLTDRFDLTPGLNWFDFPYDWRRDNRVAARQLAEQAPGWLDTWKEKSGNKDAKLVLLGHSMGGLVARAFLELYDGWKITRSLVTFGTPYRGAVNALDFLANGFEKGVGPFKLDLTRLLGSMTSVYQLCPIFPCVDTGAGELVHAHTLDSLPAGICARAARRIPRGVPRRDREVGAGQRTGSLRDPTRRGHLPTDVLVRHAHRRRTQRRQGDRRGRRRRHRAPCLRDADRAG